MSRFLGIDIGTQSARALVFDAGTQSVVAVGSAPLEMISREDGTREQRPAWWLAALGAALQQIDPAVRQSVEAIGVSGQQHGFVALAGDGTVLAPAKLWCDTATVSQCDEITTAFGGVESCIRETGNAILPGYTAPKILWLKQHHPDLYARLQTILLPHDYINFHLTGELAMECGDASGTGLLDVRQRRWHPGMLAAVDAERDLSRCLPSLVAPDGFIGHLRAEAAAELGLPVSTPVSCGGGDNMMAAIGTGNVTPGRMTVSLGTSGTLFAYADDPVIDDSGQIAAFCDSTGGWLPLLCTMNCTVATELARNAFGLSLDELERQVATIPAGSEGVITLPFFQGERTPNLPDAQGCVFGLTHNNYSAGHLLRSSMEAAVYGLRAGLDVFRQQGCEIDALRLTGGGAKNAPWRQMVADIFNLPVTVQRMDEGAALGAALQACWVHGRKQGGSRTLLQLVDEILVPDDSRSCRPDGATAAIYSEHYRRYRDHVAAITPLYQ